MNRRDPGFDVWVVVADVLVGFLCVVFLLFVVQAPTGHPPPDAVEQFAKEMNEVKEKTGVKFDVRRGFSRVQLEYGEKLLFKTCEWEISLDGNELLKQHFSIFLTYARAISRIQIEGHADSRSAASCPSLQRAGLRRDNWILSSLRALEVREFLENVLKAGTQEERPDPLGASASLLKALEAVGRGDLHPLEPNDPVSEVNRRIEITVHFKEMLVLQRTSRSTLWQEFALPSPWLA